jgi:hypothetical protein
MVTLSNPSSPSPRDPSADMLQLTLSKDQGLQTPNLAPESRNPDNANNPQFMLMLQNGFKPGMELTLELNSEPGKSTDKRAGTVESALSNLASQLRNIPYENTADIARAITNNAISVASPILSKNATLMVTETATLPQEVKNQIEAHAPGLLAKTPFIALQGVPGDDKVIGLRGYVQSTGEVTLPLNTSAQIVSVVPRGTPGGPEIAKEQAQAVIKNTLDEQLNQRRSDKALDIPDSRPVLVASNTSNSSGNVSDVGGGLGLNNNQVPSKVAQLSEEVSDAKKAELFIMRNGGMPNILIVPARQELGTDGPPKANLNPNDLNILTQKYPWLGEVKLPQLDMPRGTQDLPTAGAYGTARYRLDTLNVYDGVSPDEKRAFEQSLYYNWKEAGDRSAVTQVKFNRQLETGGQPTQQDKASLHASITETEFWNLNIARYKEIQQNLAAPHQSHIKLGLEQVMSNLGNAMATGEAYRPVIISKVENGQTVGYNVVDAESAIARLVGENHSNKLDSDLSAGGRTHLILTLNGGNIEDPLLNKKRLSPDAKFFSTIEDAQSYSQSQSFGRAVNQPTPFEQRVSAENTYRGALTNAVNSDPSRIETVNNDPYLAQYLRQWGVGFANTNNGSKVADPNYQWTSPLAEVEKTKNGQVEGFKNNPENITFSRPNPNPTLSPYETYHKLIRL